MQAPRGPQEVESLQLETSLCRALVDGVAVDLPPKEFQLLARLAGSPGEPIAARSLIQEVWPENPLMTPQDLYWYIWRLRKRLGDDARARKLIGNRPRVGYLLDLPQDAVSIAAVAPTAAASTPPPEVKSAHGRSGLRWPIRRHAIKVAAAASLVALVAGSSWAAGYTISRFRHPSPRRIAVAVASPDASVPAAPITPRARTKTARRDRRA
ncbi:MAG: helix-turn-helix domain-containing protein, partial [Actinomycetota bacterium]|nr:helix-turn-helix domain-containing protein [Actinomycetota bacterium]